MIIKQLTVLCSTLKFRFESRKRKVLKRTDGKYEIERSDDDNDDAADDVTASLTANVKDLEFKLRHDLNKLYKVPTYSRPNLFVIRCVLNIILPRRLLLNRVKKGFEKGLNQNLSIKSAHVHFRSTHVHF